MSYEQGGTYKLDHLSKGFLRFIRKMSYKWGFKGQGRYEKAPSSADNLL